MGRGVQNRLFFLVFTDYFISNFIWGSTFMNNSLPLKNQKIFGSMREFGYHLPGVFIEIAIFKKIFYFYWLIEREREVGCLPYTPVPGIEPATPVGERDDVATNWATWPGWYLGVFTSLHALEVTPGSSVVTHRSPSPYLKLVVPDMFQNSDILFVVYEHHSLPVPYGG